MLRTDSQVGPTCFAQALFNAGMIEQDALEDYRNRWKEGDREILKHKFEEGVKALPILRAMMQSGMKNVGFGVAENSAKTDKFNVGSKAFILDWMEKWMPHGIKFWQKLPDTSHELVAVALSNRGKRLIPKKGRGIAFVMEFEATPMGLAPHGHAISYEDGKVVDSNNPKQEVEDWEDYRDRKNAALVQLLPDEDKHDDFASDTFWWDYDPSVLQLRSWMM